jgi:hypothetical protein
MIETLAEARDNGWRITAQKSHEVIEYSRNFVTARCV